MTNGSLDRMPAKYIYLRKKNRELMNDHPYYLAWMEFQVTVTGESYHFTPLNKGQYLVSCDKAEYILYLKDQQWRCADELEYKLLQKFQDEIEERNRARH